jgi:hypothetical protein
VSSTAMTIENDFGFSHARRRRSILAAEVIEIAKCLLNPVVASMR